MAARASRPVRDFLRDLEDKRLSQFLVWYIDLYEGWLINDIKEIFVVNNAWTFAFEGFSTTFTIEFSEEEGYNTASRSTQVKRGYESVAYGYDFDFRCRHCRLRVSTTSEHSRLLRLCVGCQMKEREKQ